MTDWINVDERLPEDSREVLCYYLNTEGRYGYVVGSYSRRLFEGWETDIDNNEIYYQPVKITHWMPLPEPPTKDKTEG